MPGETPGFDIGTFGRGDDGWALDSRPLPRYRYVSTGERTIDAADLPLLVTPEEAEQRDAYRRLLNLPPGNYMTWKKGKKS